MALHQVISHLATIKLWSNRAIRKKVAHLFACSDFLKKAGLINEHFVLNKRTLQATVFFYNFRRYDMQWWLVSFTQLRFYGAKFLILGALLAHLERTLGTLWAPFGLTLAALGSHFGRTLSLLWSHLGRTLGSLRPYFGRTLGAFWTHFEPTLGALWAQH